MNVTNPMWLALVGVLVGLAFLPAILAGAGFLIAFVFAAFIILVLIVGPGAFSMLWDRHLTRSQGEKAGMSLRELINDSHDAGDSAYFDESGGNK
jgi:hypothetical protein